jgi:hypothetical protein
MSHKRRQTKLRCIGGDYSQHLPKEVIKRGGDVRVVDAVDYARLTLSHQGDMGKRSKTTGLGIITSLVKPKGKLSSN